MKRLLKPTGQILTTAVFTSTAIDAALPKAANPVPLDSSSSETTPTPEQSTIDATDIAEMGETVAPPETGSAHGASHNGLPTPSPQNNAYANVDSPLPAAFFTELERNSAQNSVPSTPSSAQVIRQQQVAAAQPPALPHSSSTDQPQSSQPLDDLVVATPNARVFGPQDGSEEISANSRDTHPLPTTASTAASVGEELPDLALPSNTTIVPQPSSSVPASNRETAVPEDLTAEIDVSRINKDNAFDRETNMAVTAEQNPENNTTTTQLTANESKDPTEPVNHPVNATQLESLTTPPITEPSESSSEQTSNPNTANEPSPEESRGDHRQQNGKSAEELQNTRNWLNQQLAIIVDQSRARQTTEHRQRLIEFARQSLETGNIEDARQVARNSILTAEERDALEVAISETAAQNFIPLIPLDSINGAPLNRDSESLDRQSNGPSGSLPSSESLPTLPTTPLATPNPIQTGTAIASSSERLPSLPLSSSGLHQWPLSNPNLPPASSLTADELKQCLMGEGDINIESLEPILDGSSPRITATSGVANAGTSTGINPKVTRASAAHTNNKSMALKNNKSMALNPMAYIGTGQQPPSSLKTSDAFPVGGDFLAGVGQQPPSILPEASWAGAPILSGEPVPLKWTRSKLNQELEALNESSVHVNANDTGTKALPDDCRKALERQQQARQQHSNQARTPNGAGGPTLAGLTGYEWLSQFAIARSSNAASGSSSSPRQLLQMILPLPQATPMTSGFGWRSHPIYGGRRFHFGLDYGAPRGTPILASISGRIETTGSLNGYGLTVVLENNDLNLRNLYAHMSGIAVEEGTWVEQGTVIGWVGSTGNSTGPHLHFEVHKQTHDGWVAVDPLKAAAELLQIARS